jgi:hypothetical protein
MPEMQGYRYRSPSIRPMAPTPTDSVPSSTRLHRGALHAAVAAWVPASEQVTARDNCLLDPTRIRPLSMSSEGRSHTCLSNKLERNIGECAGSGVLSQSPAERLGGELEFEQPSCSSNGSAQSVQIRLQRSVSTAGVPCAPRSPRSRPSTRHHQRKIIDEAACETHLILPAVLDGRRPPGCL